MILQNMPEAMLTTIQTEGFKNVSLGNVLGAKAPNEPIPFIKETDLAVYQKHRDAAFEVQVGK